MTESAFRAGPSTDYRHRLELVEDALAAVLGRAAAAPAAREERDRCVQVAERILTKAHALVGALASPSSEPRPGLRVRTMIPPKAANPDAAFERERDAILRDASDREQEEEP